MLKTKETPDVSSKEEADEGNEDFISEEEEDDFEDELEDELLLNTSSVLRLAIRNLYNQQIKNKGDL